MGVKLKKNSGVEMFQQDDDVYALEDSRRDIVLWEKIKKGETEALGELYDHYVPLLFSYGFTLCSKKDVATDSIHDLFVDLYKYRNKLAEKPQVKYYLMVSLKRKIYQKSSFRKMASEMVHENNYTKFDLFEASVEEKIIDFEIIVNQTRQVNKALTGLPKKQKMAIHLKFFEGKSYEEIARIMNVKIETSRSLIYRSMGTLRQLLS